jgi:hypothetical protein
MRRAPGHNRDMMVVTAESAGKTFCFFSDLVPTAAHVQPTWVAAFDLSPMETIASKMRWLTAAAEGNGGALSRTRRAWHSPASRATPRPNSRRRKSNLSKQFRAPSGGWPSTFSCAATLPGAPRNPSICGPAANVSPRPNPIVTPVEALPERRSRGADSPFRRTTFEWHRKDPWRRLTLSDLFARLAAQPARSNGLFGVNSSMGIDRTRPNSNKILTALYLGAQIPVRTADFRDARRVLGMLAGWQPAVGSSNIRAGRACDSSRPEGRAKPVGRGFGDTARRPTKKAKLPAYRTAEPAHPGPSQLTPSRIDRQIDLTKQVLSKHLRHGYLMQDLGEEFEQFRPGPSREELNHLLNLPK